MIKKLYPFSILEVIIATSLFALLMFTTTSLFFRYHKLNTKLNDLRPIILERSLCYEKLLEMSGTIDKGSLVMDSLTYEHFFSFEFDNGYKDNANLSGKAKCSLFRDENSNLCYLIENKKKKAFKRVLLKNISAFEATDTDNTIHIDISFPEGDPIKYTFLLGEKGKGK